MATKTFSLQVQGNDDVQPFVSGAASLSLHGLINYLRSCLGGARNGDVTLTARNSLVAASGTVTVASIQANDTVTINGVALTSKQQRATGTLTAATAIADDTFSVNGVEFTGVTGAVVLGDAEFSVDTGDNECAASIAAQINAHASLAGIVTATASTDTVTVRAVTAGTAGNSIALVGTVTTLEASAATLLGGIAVANNEFEAIGTDAQIATDLVRAIGASTSALVSSHVTAAAADDEVTISAAYPGILGNTITLASSDAGRLLTSGARLTGGTETLITFEF